MREDVNDLPPGAGDSISWCRDPRRRKRRASAARTCLHPALKQPNLQPSANALVHRVLFDDTQEASVRQASNFARRRSREGGRRARGDPVGWRGQFATSCTVGVGGAEHLAEIGVPVVHELRGVGLHARPLYRARLLSGRRHGSAVKNP
jgi:choline dehydrogenase